MLLCNELQRILCKGKAGNGLPVYDSKAIQVIRNFSFLKNYTKFDIICILYKV